MKELSVIIPIAVLGAGVAWAVTSIFYWQLRAEKAERRLRELEKGKDDE